MVNMGRRNDPLLFTSEERAILQYMLPTYLTAEPFIRDDVPYVKKPVYSREGNTVEIYEGSGRRKCFHIKHYVDNLFIYQQYVEMPSITVQLKKDITLRSG